MSSWYPRYYFGQRCPKNARLIPRSWESSSNITVKHGPKTDDPLLVPELCWPLCPKKCLKFPQIVQQNSVNLAGAWNSFHAEFTLEGSYSIMGEELIFQQLVYTPFSLLFMAAAGERGWQNGDYKAVQDVRYLHRSQSIVSQKNRTLHLKLSRQMQPSL